MRVFITGAAGFIGTRLTRELISTGYEVLGMARSDAGAAALQAAGAEVHFGTLQDLDSLSKGAEAADAVIHLAFDHDFTRWAESCEEEKIAIAALGAGLAGSRKPLIVTSGTAAAITPGRLTTEEDAPSSPIPRVASENAALELQHKGVDIRVVRLPQVHDPLKQGLISPLALIAREKGVAAYVGDGSNRWPAAHVSDVAKLYQLAIDKGEPFARYHAVDEEGVSAKAIFDVVGKGMGLPVKSLSAEEAAAQMGFLGHFVAADLPASSAITREKLGWEPKGPGMIADLEAMDYSVFRG